MSKCDLFIFAGEKSGDVHGGKLLHEIRNIHPQKEIWGVGGPSMREEGLNCILLMEDFQVMGFVDVFFALPRLVKQFYRVKNFILSTQPSTVVLIDYPGFNLRLAAQLRKAGFSGRICHYICPSVWAWGKKRIPHMASTLDMLLSILPFEKSYFSETTLPVHYVGHPLVTTIESYAYQPLSNFSDECVLALFPGSRRKEIERNLHLQLVTAKKLRLHHPTLQIALSVAYPEFIPLFQHELTRAGFSQNDVQLVPAERSYDLMKQAHFALATSGTVTLELALHSVPTVVTYGISNLDLFIAQQVLRIDLPFYCLVNILAHEEVFVELFGPKLTTRALYQAAKTLLENPVAHSDCQEKCRRVQVLLGRGNSHRAAAELILCTQKT